MGGVIEAPRSPLEQYLLEHAPCVCGGAPMVEIEDGCSVFRWRATIVCQRCARAGVGRCDDRDAAIELAAIAWDRTRAATLRTSPAEKPPSDTPDSP